MSIRRANTFISIVVLLALVIQPLAAGAAAPQPQAAKPPAADPADPGFLFRASVTLAGSRNLARLEKLGVVVLASDQWSVDSGQSSITVLADADQLEALARLGFRPRAADELRLLVSAQGPEKAWLAAGLRPLLAQADAVVEQQAMAGVAGAAAAPDAAAIQALRAAMHALTPEQLTGVAGSSSIDDDADGLTNTQEAWWCTDPLNPDTDSDGRTDGAEIQALKDWVANQRASAPGETPWPNWPMSPTSLTCPDKDSDSIPNMAERWELGLNMDLESSDRDKFDDGQELFGVTYCPGSGTGCGYGAFPPASNDPNIVMFPNMPSFVKAPGNHPLVAAFPVPEVDVVESSLKVETVTEVTTDHVIVSGTEKSYSTAKTEGTSTSVADTTTWNEWQEVSVATPMGSLQTREQESRFDQSTAASPDDAAKFLKVAGATAVVAAGACEVFSALLCTPVAAPLALVGGAAALVGELIDTGPAPTIINNDYIQNYGQLNLCRGEAGSVVSCSNKSSMEQTSQQVVNLQSVSIQTQDRAAGGGGTQYGVNAQSHAMVQPTYQLSVQMPRPVPIKTVSNGKSWGGSQTTTSEKYEEQTITNGEAFSNEESWGNATAQNSAHAANLWFTYKVRNTGTEYAREIGDLAFNVYLGDDPNPIYTYFIAPDLGGDGKFHNFMPGEEHQYSSRANNHAIPLTLEQMKAIEVHPSCKIWREMGRIQPYDPNDPATRCPGSKLRVVVEDFTYGADEIFYQDAANAGVLLAMEDGTEDGDEAIDTYLIPTWGEETVLDVLGRYFPHTTDENGMMVAVWTPEYRADTPAWCVEPTVVGAGSARTLWCKHALSTADWWNVYTDGMGDGSEGFQDTPAAAGQTALFRFNSDSDLDGYSDRSEEKLGTDPNDPASYPKPELIAGLYSKRDGNNVVATLSLLNTGVYDAYGVEAVMIAPDDTTSITNNTVGGSGRVRAQRQIIVGSRIAAQTPLPAAWLAQGHAQPVAGGYYSGDADRTYTFTVAGCGDSLGCPITSTLTLNWSDDQGASGSLAFDNTYKSPTLRGVGAFGLQLGFRSGKVFNGDSFTVAATTPRDTFQYAIADGHENDYTLPIVVVSYNDPQGNHRFVTPINLTSPTDNLIAHTGKMLPGGAGVEIVTSAPFTATQANTTNLVVQAPPGARMLGAHLFLEFIDPNGTVVREEAVTSDLEPGPNLVAMTWNPADFNPAYDPAQDYIVMAFFTDWQGNIVGTAGRPLSSFQADPKPALAYDATSTTWNFGSVAQGTMLNHTFTLGNTGLTDLKATVVGTGTRVDQEVASNPAWIDTGLDVATGDALGVRAGGTVCYDSGVSCYGPDGNGTAAPAGWTVTGAPQASLVAKIGNGTPFFVGTTYVATATAGGRLYLGTNDCTGCYADNGGSYQAHIEIQGLPTGFGRSPSLSVSPAGIINLDVALDTYYLPVGAFDRSVTVRTSDPTHPTLSIRVQGTVQAYAPPAQASAISPYRPWDQKVAVSGDRTARALVTFDDVIAADESAVQPLWVYNDTRQARLGSGKLVARQTASGTLVTATVAAETSTGEADLPTPATQTPAAEPAMQPDAIAGMEEMFGDGRDGDLLVPAGQTTTLNAVRVNVSASGNSAIPSNSTGFNVGDVVLFHQTQGADSAGRWELNTITAINSANSWTLARPLSYGYSSDSVGQTCGGGFWGEYYGNRDLGGSPVFGRCDSPLDLNWGAGSPGAGIPNDLFSARWTGQFFFFAANNYQIDTCSDDGYRLYVDGQLSINRWQDQDGCNSDSRYFSAGAHTLVLEYYENGGNAHFSFKMKTASSVKAQAIRIPQFRSVTVQSGGNLTATAWDGSTGGILAVMCSGTMDVIGSINVTGYGFRGGTYVGNHQRGFSGEGSAGPTTQTYTPNGSGGGGGENASWGDAHASGGGGGNSTTGTNARQTHGNFGQGGNQVGTSDLSNMHLGGGGGGSACGWQACNSGSGGNGGGIVFVAAKSLISSGTILAQGTNGQNGDPSGWGGPGSGGGGAGGSVYITTANGMIFDARIDARYGFGGYVWDGGGASENGRGSTGRISIGYCDTLTGTTNPAANIRKLTCYGTITGKVWSDNNSSGGQDAGEPNMVGVTVTLSGVGTTTTAGDGTYSFANVIPGSYTVSVTPPVGYVNTTSGSVGVNVASNSTNTVNFGILPRASVTGKVFHDTNNNGSQGTGEPGVARVTVTLSTGATRTTDTNGAYTFADLMPGSYSVSVSVPDGYVNTTATTVPVPLIAGQVGAAHFGILMYAIEKVGGSDHANRFFLPETSRGGRRYWVQYGHSLVFSAAGDAIATVKLPKAHYSAASLDVLIVSAGAAFLQANLDVGNNGSYEWGYNANTTPPKLLSASNLAAGLNAFMATATPDADGLVAVPIRLNLNTSGQVYLTNLVTTPDGVSDVAIAAADVGLNPTTVIEGEPVDVQATLRNSTPFDSGALVVSFQATPPGGTPWYIGSTFVPNVPAGGSYPASLAWNTLGFTGAVPVRVTVDPAGYVAETNETNNVATATLTIRTRPDLSIGEGEDWVFSDREPAVGETVTVTLPVRNAGQTTAGAQTVALYEGNPDAGGTLVGDPAWSPLPGGTTTPVSFAWTPATPGLQRLFARADRDGQVDESDEGNNDRWLDVYVGFRGPILVDSGLLASDVAYTATLGYGAVDEGQPDESGNCGTEPWQTFRRDPGGRAVYRFDHLLPGHFYHLDLSLYLCGQAARDESVYVDGNLVAGPEHLGDGQRHRLSLRLDPALYADRTISVAVETAGLGGALVNEINLYDIDYRYSDAGGANDPAYTAGRGYGYLPLPVTSPRTQWGTLPFKSLRENQSGNRVSYRYDGLLPSKRYQAWLSFWQNTGSPITQKVQINGIDTGTVLTIQSGLPYSTTINVPTSYYMDGTITVTAVRTDATTSAMVNEIALEERTLLNLPAIRDVRVTNIGDTAATISWLSADPADGQAHYGPSPALGAIGQDDRVPALPSRTHQVTLLDLTPETQYYFYVTSADSVGTAAGGALHQFTSGPSLSLPSADMIYGQVFNPDNSPAAGALVYVTLRDADGQDSPGAAAPLSALVDPEGNWGLNLGSARTADNLAPFTYDPTNDRLDISATQGTSCAANLTIHTADDYPAPPMTLACPTQVTHSLGTSWNLVGLNVRTDPATAAEVALDDIVAQGGNAIEIERWWNGGWDAHVRDLPFNNFALELGRGYFVRTTKSSAWARTGTPPSSPLPVELYPGWNLISIPKLACSLAAENVLVGIAAQGGACGEMDRWYAGNWQGHIKGLSLYNFAIATDQGYFVKCTQRSTYVPCQSAAESAVTTWPQPAAPAPVTPESRPAIRDVQVSNRRDVAFTVSWRTDRPSTGWLAYGAAGALDGMAYDDRGKETVGTLHHVTVVGLAPETAYAFRVHSGESTADGVGVPYQATTTAAMTPTLPLIAYGQALDTAGLPVAGALVRAQIAGAAEPLSALTDGWGYWSLSLPLDDCAGQTLLMEALGPDGTIASAERSACDVQPVPPLTLRLQERKPIYLPLVVQ